jgi:hypothetical protein
MKRSEELQKHYDWIIDRTNNFTIAIQNKMDQIEKQIEIEKLKESEQN